MSKQIYYTNQRHWLNSINHHDSGAVHFKVSRDSDYKWVDASFTVWDCSRKITLDFNFEDNQEAQHRAEKIDILIEALYDMRKALGAAWADSQNIEEEE